jgi:hypothetical protein
LIFLKSCFFPAILFVLIIFRLPAVNAQQAEDPQRQLRLYEDSLKMLSDTILDWERAGYTAAGLLRFYKDAGALTKNRGLF